MKSRPSKPKNLRSDSGRVVLLTAGGSLGAIIVNGLVERLGPVVVIEEQPESKSDIIHRRMRLNGVMASLGQVALGVFLRAFGKRYRGRLQQIWQTNGLNPRRPADVTTYRVPSVNSSECSNLLTWLNPDVVAVYGTRIISSKTLECVTGPFINYHAGINPKYRGQHPAYWARAERDGGNAGVTIHLVDTGVDTGDILYQAPVSYTDDDTIMTYQHVQAAVALPLFARAIKDGLEDHLVSKQVELPSQQWFPPTIWTYFYIGVTRGVW